MEVGVGTGRAAELSLFPLHSSQTTTTTLPKVHCSREVQLSAVLPAARQFRRAPKLPCRTAVAPAAARSHRIPGQRLRSPQGNAERACPVDHCPENSVTVDGISVPVAALSH